MFVIAKNKTSQQAILQRIPMHDVERMKKMGVVVFEDERLAEYATCYINSWKKSDSGWQQNICFHGVFEYDIKRKKALFIARNPHAFHEAWVAFMVCDVSFQLKRKGVNGSRFLLHVSSSDLPLTPWVIICTDSEHFALISACDGRVVGASHDKGRLGTFDEFVANIGGSLCGAHLEILSLQQVM